MEIKTLRITGLSTLIITLMLSVSSSVNATQVHPQTENLGALGSSSGTERYSTGLSVTAHEAERNDTGNLLSITWGIENTSDGNVSLTWITDRTYTYTGPYFSGTTVTSGDGATRFHPIMDQKGKCLCSGNTASDFKRNIRPGEQVTYWSLYSVPTDMESLTLEVPGFEPIEDIPIS